ncbi:MAG: hypothetical protein ABI760_00560 [Ferruginibacter sp.]
MHKRFSIFIWAAIIFQLLTAVFHSLSFIIKPEAANDTEKQMLELMNTYKMNMGNGIFRTYSQLVVSFSVSLTLLCLFGGLLNWLLKRKNIASELWKGVLLVESIIFGVLFLVVLLFGFLPPMICTGLIFISCVASWINAQPIRSQ